MRKCRLQTPGPADGRTQWLAIGGYRTAAVLAGLRQRRCAWYEAPGSFSTGRSAPAHTPQSGAWAKRKYGSSLRHQPLGAGAGRSTIGQIDIGPSTFLGAISDATSPANRKSEPGPDPLRPRKAPGWRAAAVGAAGAQGGLARRSSASTAIAWRQRKQAPGNLAALHGRDRDLARSHAILALYRRRTQRA